MLVCFIIEGIRGEQDIININIKNMKKMFGALAVLAFLVGCGCQQNNEEKNGEQNLEGTIVYDCQGEEVQAVFDNSVTPAVAELSFINRDQVIITLSRVESASGAKYTDGDIVFWTQGNEAMLTTESGEKELSCVIMDPASDEEMGAAFDENGNEITSGCQTWYDGCNTCQVGEPGMPMACTRRFCDASIMEEAKCLDEEENDDQKTACAEAGGVWSEEYNSCFEDPATMADEGEK